MTTAETIPELLHADPAMPGAVAATRLGRDDRPEIGLRRADLLREVERLAAELHRRGLAGRPVLIPERNRLEYVVAFLACLRAGCMAVTAHPPRSGGGGERLEAIVRNSRPAAVVAGPDLFTSIDRIAPALLGEIDRIVYEAPTDSGITDDESCPIATPDPTIPWPDPSSIALLQYTSGSTRDPAPVALTQSNLLANGRAMRTLFQRDGVTGGTVCWMPLYHDMGLIGLLVSSLLVKVPIHLMDPEAFAMRPIRWLRAISNTGAAYSGGPCFAYDLCVDRIPEADRADLDLSTWRFAFNGAEPIRPRSLRRFQAAFGPATGFDGMMPCYGLAEHTLLVSVRPEDSPVRIRIADRAALDDGRLDVRRTVGLDDSTTLAGTDEIAVVACGPSLPDHEIVVRDPATGRRLDPGAVGEITLRGPSVASGYHDRPDQTSGIFPDRIEGDVGPWLRTGDLGAMFDGELHVLGRLKDLLIVDGRNVHPADVEATLEGSHPIASKGRAAVFALGEAGDDLPETVGVVLEIPREVHRSWRRDPDVVEDESMSITNALRAGASSVHGIRLDRITFVAPGALPRTTSGKIRRAAVRTSLLAGELPCLSTGAEGC
ncbi:MAG: fatty acyl-AMP ligase [Phycisphaeraceae bacterium]|nr:fatty acyl-AMP ligase [Phycisphaeraceae bacterium]